MSDIKAVKLDVRSVISADFTDLETALSTACLFMYNNDECTNLKFVFDSNSPATYYAVLEWYGQQEMLALSKKVS